MKKKKTLKEIYSSIRKPVAPPTRREGDRRGELRREQARREMDEYRGPGARREDGCDDT